MVEINFTFTIFTLSFVVFALLMKVFFFDKVALVINAREALVAANLKASQSTRQSIEEQLSLNSSKSLLKSAKEEAQAQLSKALAEANSQKQGLIDTAKQKISADLSHSLTSLSKDRDQVMAGIDQLVTEISNLMTDRLISEIKNSNQAKPLSV